MDTESDGCGIVTLTERSGVPQCAPRLQRLPMCGSGLRFPQQIDPQLDRRIAFSTERDLDPVAPLQKAEGERHGARRNRPYELYLTRNLKQAEITGMQRPV